MTTGKTTDPVAADERWKIMSTINNAFHTRSEFKTPASVKMLFRKE